MILPEVVPTLLEDKTPVVGLLEFEPATGCPGVEVDIVGVLLDILAMIGRGST